MIAALLVALGVELIVIVLFMGSVQGRKRWIKRQPGSFAGAIRVTSGELDGLDEKWKRGYGRWVRDVLVWTKGPLLLRNEVFAADRLDGVHAESSDQIKRIGDHPIVIRMEVGPASVEMAADSENRALLVGESSADACRLSS